MPQHSYPPKQGVCRGGARGKLSMAWFYGFKLHLLINETTLPVSSRFTS
ncbi:MAG: hypothetical protein O7D86_15550 [Proteobacteria bacterium]|nr:hypothetical protein [Pseudomonadota bacterium]